MSELISGKEAKLAWAEGVTVQVATGADRFRTLVSSDDLGIFDRGNYFRLKPRTISLNGIEVPATFNPKEGEVFYYINDYSEHGYDWANYCDNLFNNTVWIGKWRNEDEIKQVIAALRSAFNNK